MKVSKFHFNSVPILGELPIGDSTWVISQGKEKKLKKNTELFKEGSVPKEIFFLMKGKVKLYRTTEFGYEQIVYIYVPGDTFGYRPLLSGETHPASATCLEDCTLTTLSIAQFRSFLESSPQFASLLLKNLSHEFSVWVNLITAFARYSARERVALCLLILAEKYNDARNVGNSEITLSRTHLASFAGTSVETVARLLTSWKKEGIIQTRGRKIIVKNSAYLDRQIDG